MTAYNSQRVGAGTVALGIAEGAYRARARLGGEARAVRPADRRIPGPAMDAGRHVDQALARRGCWSTTPARSRGEGGFPDLLLAAQAKIFASESAIQIVNDALQFFGARGYSRELPLERMARDVRMFTIGGGTAQVLRTWSPARMLGWKLPQTRDGYAPQDPDARRRGVIMHPLFASAGEARGTPIWFVHAGNADSVLQGFGERERAFTTRRRLRAEAGPAAAAAGRRRQAGRRAVRARDVPATRSIDPFRPGQLSGLLPPGIYRFANAPHDARLAALAFALGAYQFTRYRKAEARNVRLVVPDGVDGDDLTRIAEGVTLARDLINTPSNDMGPAELEDAARALAKQHGATVAGHVAAMRWRRISR